jgi:hypothetical protein
VSGDYTLAGSKALRQTKKALLVEITHPETKKRIQEWFPHNHITDDSEVYKEGTEGNLVISHWMAVQKGFEKE